MRAHVSIIVTPVKESKQKIAPNTDKESAEKTDSRREERLNLENKDGPRRSFRPGLLKRIRWRDGRGEDFGAEKGACRTGQW